MGSYIPPSSFHTFDPIRNSPGLMKKGIIDSISGNHEELLLSVPGIEEVAGLKEGEDAPLDKATMLFISVLDWQDDWSVPRSLDGGHSRERLGRFPIDDGNAIEYLLRYTKEGDGSDLHFLLEKLCRGLNEDTFGHSGFNEGSGGIEMLGWLDGKDVSNIRREIEKGAWSVKSDEPLDGGVQDAFRHLLVFLRAAVKRKCGILMRRHS
tara:strand:- start:543 stop:1166 length:624 start_codon:yes stop_codon:yes gene_type:complete